MKIRNLRQNYESITKVIFALVLSIGIAWALCNYFSSMYGEDKSLIGINEHNLRKKFKNLLNVDEFNPYYETWGTRRAINISYPPGDPKSNIKIREYKFIYRSVITFRNRYITVWLHKKDDNWIVVDSFWVDERWNF